MPCWIREEGVFVEREASIRGHMADINRTFTTLDCAACVLTPKMSEVAREGNITLMSYSEVGDVSGYVVILG